MKTKIEKMIEKITGKKLNVSMIIYGENGETIFFLNDDDFFDSQVILNTNGKYKAIINPLSFREKVIEGTL